MGPRRKRATGVLVSAGIVMSVGATFAPPAAATFHFMMIREVFGGTSATADAQYVELQMYSSGQNLVNGARVRFYDASGDVSHTQMFGDNVDNAADNSTILIATQQAETLFDVQADLELETAALSTAGGKVCFDGPGGVGPIDCVSFGDFNGPAAGTGTPFNDPEGIPAGATIARDIGRGSNSNQLDAGDDADNSVVDFRFEVPSPRNNSGVVGAPPDAVLNFSSPRFTVAETGGAATIDVARSGGGTSTDVDYSTVAGTATADVDFIPASGTLSFAGIENSKTFDVTISDDTQAEGNETILLRLRNPSSDAVLGPLPNATLEIIDDEGPPPDEIDPVSRISRPDHGSTYRAGRLMSLRGTAQDASPIARVDIALRMTRTNGSCRWWSGAKFVRDTCGDKRWKRATGKGSWRYSLHHPLPKSAGTKVKSYTLYSRATDDPGNVENIFRKSRNANRFEIQ